MGSSRLSHMLATTWRHTSVAFVATAAGLSAAPAWAQADNAPDAAPSLPQAAVNALNKLSGGPHGGFRANHAKGVMVSGNFTAAQGAAAWSQAPHFRSGKSVPVLVRFSNATGVPNLPDADPNASPHGMAIRFQLLAQVAKEGDPVNDGSQVWPEDRQLVALGTLTLNKVLPDQDQAQRSLMFNPLLVSKGIAPSADPVLLFRPGAYAVSYAQRLK